MAATSTITIPWRGLRRDLLTVLLVSGLAAFGFVVLMLLARRLAGALVQPLGGLSLVCVAATGLLLATAWRLSWQARGQQGTNWILAVPALPGITLFILLCTLSLPATASWALMLSWLGFLTGEAAWWWTSYVSLREPRPGESVSAPSPEMLALPAGVLEETSDEELLPADLYQKITRTRDHTREQVSIQLRVPFAVGQRTAVEHIAFCPPLSATPELAAEVLSDMGATVAISEIQTFGLRLEVRLDEPADEACDVVLEIAGESELNGKRPSNSL